MPHRETGNSGNNAPRAATVRGGKAKETPPPQDGPSLKLRGPSNTGSLLPRPKLRSFAPVERIETWPVDKLVPYARNPRLHSPEQVEQIAASMREFGQAQLIIVDKRGEIIAGHGRVLAAKKNGMEYVVVGIADGWNEKKKRAYRIIDNQMALVSRWDEKLLRDEMIFLQEHGADLSLLGFEPGQREALFLNVDQTPAIVDLATQWTGMPEFEAMGGQPFRIVRVLFRSQKDIDKFAALVGQHIGKATFIWYPELKMAKPSEKRFVAR